MLPSCARVGNTSMRDKLIGLLLVAFCLVGCGSITVPASVVTSKGEVLNGSTTASLAGGSFLVSGNNGLQCQGSYDALETSPILSAPLSCNDGRAGVVTVQRTRDGRSGSGVVSLSDGSTANVGFGVLATGVLAPVQAVAITTPASLVQTKYAKAGSFGLLGSSTNLPARATDQIANSNDQRTPIRAALSGKCDCPYDRMNNGALCQARSAWSKRGGRSPACFAGETENASSSFSTPPKAISPRGCSESGSCYGDISANTGRAKTTYVRGYCRKNGKCVGGYYRS